MSKLEASFARLFAGLDRRHGRYVVPKDARPDAKGKITGKPWTASGPVTSDDWHAHLSGEQIRVAHGESFIEGSLGIGVVPIRDDASCVFGAIDVDIYPIDLKALLAKVRELELPLIVVRTKSGGAHLYLFLREPATAELVRAKLMDWAIALGHPGVEIFPRHTRLASDNDSSYWINIPYQGGVRSVRYALKDDGSSMTPEEFVAAADAIAITPEMLNECVPKKIETGRDELFEDGPPCLQVLARAGVSSLRNMVLFNTGVYLRKKHGDAFEPLLDEYNYKIMTTPLPSSEVVDVKKSVKKKNYSYGCKQEPIRSVCNRQVCLKREFGVGDANDDPGVVLGEIQKVETEPPTWIWDVDGARLEIDTATLMDQRKFQAVAIEKLTKWPTLVKPGVWQRLVRERLARVEFIPVPEDATREGQFRAMLRRFCVSKVRGKHLDEIAIGKPYTDEVAKRTFFRSTDFFDYLGQHRFSIDEKTAFKWLRRMRVESHFSKIKGAPTRYWSIVAFEEQTEPFDVPRVPPKEGM